MLIKSKIHKSNIKNVIHFSAQMRPQVQQTPQRLGEILILNTLNFITNLIPLLFSSNAATSSSDTSTTSSTTRLDY